MSVFLSLHDVPKQVFLVNQDGGQGPPGPRSDGTEIAMWQNVFLETQQRFVFTFLSSIALNSLLLFFFAFILFFGIFVKTFWQFDYAKFYSLYDYKLAIITPSA